MRLHALGNGKDCLVEDDLYAPVVLRYMDRNPVRAGVVENPAAYVKVPDTFREISSNNY